MLKNVLKSFQMSEQNWGCLDKMSEVNFSPAETLNFNGPFEIFMGPLQNLMGPRILNIHIRA